MQETQWLKAREIWFGFGPNRNVRDLQKYIQANFGTKLPVNELNAEISSRNWHIEAIEHDSRIARRIDAVTVDTMASELAQERLSSFRSMNRRFKELGGIMDTVLEKGRETLKNNKNVSLSDITNFMNTYVKVLQFMNTVEIPLLPDEDEAARMDYSDPTELGRALITANKMGDLSISDLKVMREPGRNVG